MSAPRLRCDKHQGDDPEQEWLDCDDCEAVLAVASDYDRMT